MTSKGLHTAQGPPPQHLLGITGVSRERHWPPLLSVDLIALLRKPQADMGEQLDLQGSSIAIYLLVQE